MYCPVLRTSICPALYAGVMSGACWDPMRNWNISIGDWLLSVTAIHDLKEGVMAPQFSGPSSEVWLYDQSTTFSSLYITASSGWALNNSLYEFIELGSGGSGCTEAARERTGGSGTGDAVADCDGVADGLDVLV